MPTITIMLTINYIKYTKYTNRPLTQRHIFASINDLNIFITLDRIFRFAYQDVKQLINRSAKYMAKKIICVKIAFQLDYLMVVN